MINGTQARLDFLNGVEIFKKAFPHIDNVVDTFKLTQNDLQLEQPQVANQGTYTFPVMVNQQSAGNTQFNTELRLNIQDTFLPQYVGMFIIPAASSSDTTWRPLTWANPAVITNAAQANAFYNGQFIVSVNNTNYITQWKTSRFMKVPETQQTAPLGVGSPADQIDGGEDGFYPMQPYVIISGSSNMGVTVKLANPPSAVDANHRLAIVFRGIMAYNSTVTT